MTAISVATTTKLLLKSCSTGFSSGKCKHEQQTEFSFTLFFTRPFGFDWWFWLFGTGIALGCVLSVKWVGLFAVALVGLHTLDDLWTMFGDLEMPVV